MHDIPAHIVIISAAVYSVLQLLKKFVPFITGWLAFSVNLLLSVASILAFVPPDQVYSLQTLSAIAAAIGGAAGIHGTIGTLVLGKTLCDTPAEGTAAKPPAAAALAILALVMFLPLAGCRPVTAANPAPLPRGAVDQIDAHANQVLQAAHAFASRISYDTINGAIRLTPTQGAAEERLNALLNIVDPLEISYHNCGMARTRNPTAPVCDAGQLAKQVASIETAFSAAELAFAPTAK